MLLTVVDVAAVTGELFDSTAVSLVPSVESVADSSASVVRSDR